MYANMQKCGFGPFNPNIRIEYTKTLHPLGCVRFIFTAINTMSLEEFHNTLIQSPHTCLISFITAACQDS